MAGTTSRRCRQDRGTQYPDSPFGQRPIANGIGDQAWSDIPANTEKYEKGVNRFGSSRLLNIGKILEVSSSPNVASRLCEAKLCQIFI